MMKQLTAVFPVLFGNHNYKPGDRLPVHDEVFVNEWVHNGTAVWEDDSCVEKKAVKARMAAAMPGITGNAYPSAGMGQDLMGKPPPGKTRGAQPGPSRGRRKSSG